MARDKKTKPKVSSVESFLAVNTHKPTEEQAGTAGLTAQMMKPGTVILVPPVTPVLRDDVVTVPAAATEEALRISAPDHWAAWWCQEDRFKLVHKFQVVKACDGQVRAVRLRFSEGSD